MRVSEGDSLKFFIDDIPMSMNYDIVIRYEGGVGAILVKLQRDLLYPVPSLFHFETQGWWWSQQETQFLVHSGNESDDHEGFFRRRNALKRDHLAEPSWPRPSSGNYMFSKGSQAIKQLWGQGSNSKFCELLSKGIRTSRSKTVEKVSISYPGFVCRREMCGMTCGWRWTDPTRSTTVDPAGTCGQARTSRPPGLNPVSIPRGVFGAVPCVVVPGKNLCSGPDSGQTKPLLLCRTFFGGISRWNWTNGSVNPLEEAKPLPVVVIWNQAKSSGGEETSKNLFILCFCVGSRFTVVAPSACLERGVPYQIWLDFNRYRQNRPSPDVSMLIDSVRVRIVWSFSFQTKIPDLHFPEK